MTFCGVVPPPCAYVHDYVRGISPLFYIHVTVHTLAEKDTRAHTHPLTRTHTHTHVHGHGHEEIVRNLAYVTWL